MISGDDKEGDKCVRREIRKNQHPVPIPESQQLFHLLKILDITEQDAKRNVPDGMILHQTADRGLLLMLLEGVPEPL